MQPSVSDWAYAAGQLDADGHIGMTARTHQMAVTVAVYSQDLELLQWFQDTFGGAVYHGGKNRRASQWCPGAPMEYFLNGVFEYVKTKRHQVELILEYRAMPRGRTESQRQEMAARMRKLNGRLPALYPKE